MVRKRLGEINTCDIEDITWVKDGKEVEFVNYNITDWDFTGLHNTDIIFSKEYKVKEEN